MDRRHFLFLPGLLLAACGREPTMWRNTDLTGATFGRQLAFDDHTGRRRTLADFRGKTIVVFFGYTSCPDICPTMLARLTEVMQALGADAAQVQVLFVTLDPERDSAERLQRFVPWFHPSFLGLRGNAAETRAVTDEFRIFSSRKEVASELGYILDHSSGAYLFDPAGRLRLYIRDTASVDDIAADIRQLLAGR